MQTKPNLYATGIKLLKLVKTLLNVASRKADVTNWLLLNVILISKNEKESFFFKFRSKVNVWLFSVHTTYNSQNCLNVIDRSITKISSKYLLKTLDKMTGTHSKSHCFSK